jgi:hypothetical protein
MHGLGYWILQFLFAAVTMFLLLIGVDLLSGANVGDSLWGTLAWAVTASALFTGARYSRARRG